MLCVIENARLRVSVSSRGAELQSVYGKAANTEYLWQGDPAFWSGRAPNLFPVCGRLTEEKYTCGGKVYRMDIHGFAKDAEWAVVRQEADTVTLRLCSSPDTLRMYPWRFSLDMTYTLTGSTLSAAFIVHNLDETPMRFAVGGHPGFNVPLSAGEAFEDYFIEFDEPCTPELLIMSDSCFYTGEVRPVPTDAQNRLWLTHRMFDRDAWFFRNTAKGLTLRSVHGARRVHMAFPDMTYIGLWHRPFSEAPYVCIEPWSGSPGLDRPGVAALEDKPDMTVLPPCGIYRNTYTMTFA